MIREQFILTVSVAFIAFLTDIATLSATRLVMKPLSYRMASLRKEQEDLMRELKRAAQEGEDKAKLRKKQERLQQIQMTIAKITLRQQVKLFLIFPPLFIVLFLFVIPQIYPLTLVVAYLPFHFYWLGVISTQVRGATELTFIGWYIICASGFSFPLSRIFGIAKMR